MTNALKTALNSSAYHVEDEDFDERLLARLAKAEAEDAAQAEAEEFEYSNALITFDEVAKAKDSTLDAINASFEDLMAAALDNPSGQDVIREAQEVLDEGTKWLVSDDDERTRIVERPLPTDTEAAADIEDRISIANVRFVTAADDLAAHVAFDIAVDGKVVASTLEWIDDDRELVKQDCHLGVNLEFVDRIEAVLGEYAEDDDLDIGEHVDRLLSDAVDELRQDNGDAWLDQFGSAIPMTIAKAAYAIRYELVADGTIESSDIDDDAEYDGIDAYIVPQFTESRGWVDAQVVLFRDTGRAAVVTDGSDNPTWVDARTVEEALLECFFEDQRAA